MRALMSLLFSSLLIACSASVTNSPDAGSSGTVCNGVTCNGHGTCVANGASATCTCNTDFHADGLSCLSDADACSGQTCSGHGTCAASGGSASCTCNTGFHVSGLNCLSDADACSGQTCSGHGTCAASGGSATCTCNTGFHVSGLNCLADADPCSGQTCSGHGTCVASGTSATCTCNAGFQASGLSCLSGSATLLFEDTFQTLSLYDLNNPGAGGPWTPSYQDSQGNGGIMGKGWFVNPFNPATPFNDMYTIAPGGGLLLHVKNTPAGYSSAVGGAPYLSCQMRSTHSFSHKYGYFETSQQVINPVPGLGPSFVVWAPDVAWPPENDVSEIVSQNGSWFSKITVHSNFGGSEFTRGAGFDGVPFDPSVAHIFGMDWQPNWMRYYYDGQLVLDIPPPADNSMPEWVQFSFDASDGSWGDALNGTVDAQLKVAYVRVWDQYPY